MPSRFARLFAWSGGALFCLSLLYFLFTYAITFAEIWPGAFSSGAVAADVVLFSVFALHHSIFARGPMRAWVARHVPAYLERSVYVWIASALFILVCADWQYVQGVAWYIDGVGAWVLHVLQLAGVVITIRAAAALDAFELAGIRQLAGPQGPALHPDDRRAGPVLSDPAIEFKTRGPYGWVRHPIYAGWFLIVWPVPLMTMTRLVFAVTSCVYLLIAIPLEERTLRATAGAAYEGYQRTVRWRLLPFVY